MQRSASDPLPAPDPSHAPSDTGLLEALLFATGEAESFDGAVAAALKVVCDMTGWFAGQAWAPHPSGGFLVALPAYYSTTGTFPALRAASGAFSCALGEGLPGRASATGEPVWVRDIGTLEQPRLNAARRSGLTCAFAFPVRVKNEALVVLEFFGVRPRPEDAEWVQRIGTAVQKLEVVLKRKHSEQTLRDAEGRFRSIIQGAPFGFMRATVGGRIIEGNARLATMLGYGSAADLADLDVGRQLYVDPDDATRLLELWAVAPLATGAEMQWKQRDGTPITVRLKGRAVMDSATGTAEWETLVEDVTHAREDEREVRLAEKMDAVGRLAGGIAHDFNNVLMAISGYAEMLANDLPAHDRRRDDVREISKAADRGASLTRQLLAFSRKQPIVAPRRLDLGALLVDMQQRLRSLMGEGVELVMNAPTAQVWVMGDVAPLEQLVMNLVLNAREAIVGTGRITVTVAGAPVAPPTAGRRRGVDRGGAVSVSVADTGSGMSAEVKLRMFEPFFTTKNAAKGTGLGLCTVYGIVKQTRGHIAVESIVGQGTCITVHFPDAGGAPPPESQRVVTALLRGTETVLLVEDESSVRALVRAVLIRCGYTVIEAEDGELALEVSDQHTAPIQLMITDVVMPKMNGPELAHAMEQRRPGIKVLFMSGYIDGTALDSGHDAPAPFIQKPFVADALSRVVRDVLDAPAPIRESIATV